MKHGAIFDMDGTLFDTEKLYRRAWLDVAPEFGEKPNPELPIAASGTNMGNESVQIVGKFYPNIDAQAYINRVLELVEAWRERGLQLMTGVEEILNFFRDAGVKTAVASAAPVEVIEQNLTQKNLRGYFEVLVGGNMVANGKPAPDIFLLAAKKLNLAAEDCYIFEDSFNGIRAANASGGVTIMIPDTMQPTDEIKNLCAGVFDNLLEARRIISEGQL
ncbi:MAG: HAD family phosphatase [Selenomonadaceae bacterium]|nr:HAD family phosphatase [Selenomonadaceae bacterium]